MGSKKSTTTNSSQTSGPSAMAQPYWNQVYGGAGAAYAATPKTAAETYAPANDQQHQATQMLSDWATSGAPGQTQGNVSGAINQLQGGYQPYDISGAIQGAINPYYNNLVEKVLPQARSASIAQGAYDSPRQDITNGQLIRDAYTNPVAGIISQAELQNHQNQQNYNLQAGNQIGNLSQMLQQLQLAPAQALGAAGTQEQQWQQGQLTANSQAPWNGLPQYASILSTLPSTTQTGTQTQTQKSGSPFGDIFKGLAGGASLFM